ncbi:hypothetical protein HPP92_025127 [Vanilla planifolia]|uniref:TFIIS N-terminal domain-containing protein n=1 Tax=Vanilla planifolia TaxID=51239 RepID=A0A835PJC5_VANPL|nr:hypothetical protein HPP92_025127 [Vanilla planifolia]
MGMAQAEADVSIGGFRIQYVTGGRDDQRSKLASDRPDSRDPLEKPASRRRFSNKRSILLIGFLAASRRRLLLFASMAVAADSLDYWRKFFQSADGDIFEVINRAILVAAADCPKDFRSRRDQIAEKLFTCRLSRCFGCNRVELQVPDDGEEVGEEEGGSVKRVAEKDSKVDSSNSDPEDFNRGGVSNYSYDEAEALTEEMDEESQIVGEVMRIKEVLCNHHDESDSFLFESLRRLQLMELSVETLKVTEIGRAVNVLRKHNSKAIRNIVRSLIEGWKKLVDEWVNAAAAIADHSPESVNPSSMVDDEEGLPSPPLDEGALFATQTTNIQLSEFFDEMDDDGNLRTSVDFSKNRDIGRPVLESNNHVKRQELPKRQEICFQQARPNVVPAQAKLQGSANKLTRPSCADSGPGRPPQLPHEQKASIQSRKPTNNLQDKPKHSEEASVRAKLELAKRRLHERYQEAENAKKQRTIQMMELHDLPKQASNYRPPKTKTKNQLRNWANARRSNFLNDLSDKFGHTIVFVEQLFNYKDKLVSHDYYVLRDGNAEQIPDSDVGIPPEFHIARRIPGILLFPTRPRRPPPRYFSVAFNRFMRLRHAVTAAKCFSVPFFSVHDIILRAQSLAQTKQAHGHASASGILSYDLTSSAALIIAYSTFDDPKSSSLFFDHSPLKFRGAFLWNALVRASSRSGLHFNSISVYNSMLQNSISPDDRTFPFALSVCSAAVSKDFCFRYKGRELHGSLLKLGFYSDVFVSNTLLSFYGACMDTRSARMVFDEMPNRDVISWNSMISTLSSNDLCKNSLRCFFEMVRLGLAINSVSLISVLPACGTMQDVNFCEGVHGYALKVGLDADVMVANAFIGAYGKCEEFDCSMRVFRSVTDKNDASWNSIIGVLVHSGHHTDAIEMFRDMLSGEVQPNAITVASLLPSFEPSVFRLGREVHAYSVKNGMDSDVFVANSLLDMYAKCGRLRTGSVVFERITNRNAVSWNAMIANCAQNGDEQQAIRLLGEMQTMGETPNGVTFTNVLPACARMASLKKGKEIHARSIHDGHHLDLFVSNALVDMYVKCGRLNLARNVFNTSERDEVSYNSLILGYSQTMWCLEALLLFQEMRVMGLEHDTVSFMGALSACANIPALKHGKEVHCLLVRKLLHFKFLVSNSILDMYNRCGRIDLGRKVFDEIASKDVASWNSMIIGYGMQGELETALDLFDSMADDGVARDHVSYVAALSICSHGGMVERGKKYFGLLSENKVKLTQMHCACMVDLFGRAGRVAEAAEFIGKMPFEADSNVWGALLGACRVYGNIEVARWAAEHLFRLKPEHSGYYVLLANMYAEAGRWVEANNVRRLMKSRRVKKNPACSWVDGADHRRAFLMDGADEILPFVAPL